MYRIYGFLFGMFPGTRKRVDALLELRDSDAFFGEIERDHDLQFALALLILSSVILCTIGCLVGFFFLSRASLAGVDGAVFLLQLLLFTNLPSGTYAQKCHLN